jgi:NTP pyrophosphatase (non-canonical NTP hydrolase)
MTKSPTSAAELKVLASQIEADAGELVQLLEDEGSRREFFRMLDDIEENCGDLRRKVVLHCRANGQGIKKDGKPDMRYSRSS